MGAGTQGQRKSAGSVDSRRRGNDGVALILVMLAILVLTTLAAAMVFSARAETLASYNFRIGTQAEYAARAGIQRAINFFNNNTLYASLSPVSGPPSPTLTYTPTGYVPANSYDVVVTMVTSTGQETAPSPRASITLSATGGITVTSPGAQAGFTRYRVYAGLTAGTLVYRTTTDLGTNYTIELLSSNPDPQPAAPAVTVGTGGAFLTGTYDFAVVLHNNLNQTSGLSALTTVTVSGFLPTVTVISPPSEGGTITSYDVYAGPTATTPLHWQGNQTIGTPYVAISYNAVGSAPGSGSPPAPSLSSTSGSIPSGSYVAAVTIVDNTGKEWWQSGTTPISLSSNQAITVASPSAVPGASFYRVYAGPSAGSMQMQSTLALGTPYTITPMAATASPPASASPGLNPFYQLSVYNNNPVDLYFTDATAVPCSSNCSHSGEVTLGASSSASNYPPASATLDANNKPLDVVTNWVNSLSNASISDGTGGTGNYTVTAKLLDYHTVNNAFFGVPAKGCTDTMAPLGICRQPYEVWQVTSTGSWNNNIGAGAANPTVVIQTTVAPLYLSYFGNALYGLCRVVLSGGVCTDSYNSATGSYGGSSTTSCTTTSTTSGTNASANGADVGSNGGITLNGTVKVGGDVSFADSTNNSSCDTGFKGNDSGVAGSVLPGPSVPAPPAPDMTLWGYAATSGGPPYVNSSAQAVQFSSGGGHTASVANVYMRNSVNPWPPYMPASDGSQGTQCPPGYSGYLMKYRVDVSGTTATYSGSGAGGTPTCVGLTGSGISTDPYRLGNVDASTGSNPVFNFIGPGNGTGDPTYIAANYIDTGNSGLINFSYAAPPTPGTVSGSYSQTTSPPNSPVNQKAGFVVDVGDYLNVAGQSVLNCSLNCKGIPSPDYLRMNVLGNEGAGSSGACSGGSTAVGLGGQGQLSAIITAPNGSAKLSGSGSGGVFFGSILASNVLDCGGYAVHYDLSTRVESGVLYNARAVSVTRPQM